MSLPRALFFGFAAAMLGISGFESSANFVEDESQVPSRLRPDLEFLDQAYPEVDIEFVAVKGTFGPELIGRLSEEWGIPRNFMFIGSPGDRFPYRLEELGGVRLII